MRCLGIDHGAKRVGLAISCPEGRVAVGLAVLDGRDRHRLLTQLGDIVEREQVQVVVVGLPLSLSGSVGPQAEKVERFAERLRYKFGEEVRVELWDERLTSKQVDRTVLGAKGKGADGSRDIGAATVLLQSFLDRNRTDRPGTVQP